MKINSETRRAVLNVLDYLYYHDFVFSLNFTQDREMQYWLILSAVDDIFNVLAYKMTNKNGGSNSGNQIDYTENTRDNASNIASIALEKFINIKPTVYKQHGDLVGVYVNRDVDFSKVYKISRKK